MTISPQEEDYLNWSLLTTSNAVQIFADRLSEEKNRAGVTFREIAASGYRDHSQMVRATKGKVLPTWEVTQAFLLGCGVARHNLGPWRQFWHATRSFLAAEQQLRMASVEMSVNASLARRGSGVRLTKDWLEVQKANTPAQFGLALRHLLEHYGLHSARDAAQATGVPKSTLSDWFDGKRVPSAVRLDALLTNVGATQRTLDEFSNCLDRIRDRRWSQSAVDQLKQLYPRLGKSALVWRLGRSADAIQEKVEELGLSSSRAVAS
ncbi:helix-turn-helix transcriptional regulator [Kribbella sp. NPDC005582]|uniref:helix-turn-helix domain-containing protein n=1 Tax=Kribbella sp. NPDC005582 TaxID=3156893 RepID=UPI0033B06E65